MQEGQWQGGDSGQAVFPPKCSSRSCPILVKDSSILPDVRATILRVVPDFTLSLTPLSRPVTKSRQCHPQNTSTICRLLPTPDPTATLAQAQRVARSPRWSPASALLAPAGSSPETAARGIQLNPGQILLTPLLCLKPSKGSHLTEVKAKVLLVAPRSGVLWRLVLPHLSFLPPSLCSSHIGSLMLLKRTTLLHLSHLDALPPQTRMAHTHHCFSPLLTGSSSDRPSLTTLFKIEMPPSKPRLLLCFETVSYPILISHLLISFYFLSSALESKLHEGGNACLLYPDA